jgi:hypothetical protein
MCLYSWRAHRIVFELKQQSLGPRSVILGLAGLPGQQTSATETLAGERLTPPAKFEGYDRGGR